MIPREFVQRLREAVAISEVVGRRVPLKRTGRNYQACCPFHQEKSPSFTVDDTRGTYHCFGCRAHGDIFKFLMEFEKMSYPEAIEAIAREAGMTIPKPSPEQQRREVVRRSLEEVLDHAALWYTQQLHHAAGHAARDYLLQRGVTPKIQQQFRLGFAPDSRTGLKNYLLSQHITEQQMLEAGLIIQPEQGASYDRFRDRLIFPIGDAQDRVIAFGGRLLRKDEKAAKYLNSPETELFHKGQVLYHFRQARAAMTDAAPLLIVEGYMDVISLTQYGFSQAVAPLGTALTAEHLQKIWQACDAPILCLDGDTAGQRAMWRVAEMAIGLLQPQKTLRFCVLPKGSDPDDYVRQQGAESFRKLLASAQPLSRVVIEHLRHETGEDSPEQRAALEAKLEALAQRIPHASLQQHFRNFFREQLWARKKSSRRNLRPSSQAVSIDPRKQGMIQLEKQILRVLLNQPLLWQNLAVEHALESLHFQDAQCSKVQHWLLEHLHKGEAVELPEQAVQLRDDATIPLPAQGEQHPEIAWKRLLNQYLLVQLRSDLAQVEKEYTNDLDDAAALLCIERMNELNQQIRELEAQQFT
jgi:DNA primase